jgi:hypothetical protein
MSHLKIESCQVEVSATNWKLVQMRPTNSEAMFCDLDISSMRRPWHSLRRTARGQKFNEPLRYVYPDVTICTMSLQRNLCTPLFKV